MKNTSLPTVYSEVKLFFFFYLNATLKKSFQQPHILLEGFVFFLVFVILITLVFQLFYVIYSWIKKKKKEGLQPLLIYQYWCLFATLQTCQADQNNKRKEMMIVCKLCRAYSFFHLVHSAINEMCRFTHKIKSENLSINL